jgi:hypothetical protein
VGTHYTLEEFLDKGRPGMSSTFITHLRVAGKLVNARGVHQLYHSRISGWSLLLLVLAAAVTVLVAVRSRPPPRSWPGTSTRLGIRSPDKLTATRPFDGRTCTSVWMMAAAARCLRASCTPPRQAGTPGNARR